MTDSFRDKSIFTDTQSHTQTHRNTDTHKHTYTHTHTQRNTHIHTHTHTHTHTLAEAIVRSIPFLTLQQQKTTLTGVKDMPWCGVLRCGLSIVIFCCSSHDGHGVPGPCHETNERGKPVCAPCRGLFTR